MDDGEEVGEEEEDGEGAHPEPGAGAAGAPRRKRRRRRGKTTTPAAKDEASEPDGTDSTKWTVVIVDDERVNLRLTEQRLQRLGYECVALSDGIYLPNQLSSLRASGRRVLAVLLDIMMVHSKGTDVCRALRRGGDDVPVAAMTGNVMESDVEEYQACGFNSVLGKPFDSDDMAAFLELCHGHDATARMGEEEDATWWDAGNVQI